MVFQVKKPKAVINLLSFIRTLYKPEIIQVLKLPCNDPSSVLIPSNTPYSKWN